MTRWHYYGLVCLAGDQAATVPVGGRLVPREAGLLRRREFNTKQKRSENHPLPLRDIGQDGSSRMARTNQVPLVPRVPKWPIWVAYLRLT